MEEPRFSCSRFLSDQGNAVRVQGTVRSEWNVPPRLPITVNAHGADATTADRLRPHLDHVRRLAGLESFTFADAAPERDPETVRRVVRDFELHIPLAGIVDRAQEAERVRRELERLVKQRNGLRARLENRSFLERADPDVVQETRARTRRRGSARRSWSAFWRSYPRDDRRRAGEAAARTRLAAADYRHLVGRALAEDIDGGDRTTEATVPCGPAAASAPSSRAWWQDGMSPGSVPATGSSGGGYRDAARGRRPEPRRRSATVLATG